MMTIKTQGKYAFTKEIDLLDFSRRSIRFLEMSVPPLSGHSLRVAYLARALAEALGFGEGLSRRVILAALLHDLGIFFIYKVKGLYDEVHRLAQKELDEVEEGVGSELAHCVMGERILAETKVMAHLAPLVRLHHPRDNERDLATFESLSPEERTGACAVALSDAVARSLAKRRLELMPSSAALAEIFDEVGRSSPGYFLLQASRDGLIEALRSVLSQKSLFVDIRSEWYMDEVLRSRHGHPSSIGVEELTGVVRVFVKYMEARSPYTAHHTRLTTLFAQAMVSRLGSLSLEEVAEMTLASWFHDLGKMLIPLSVLHKKGPLSPEEWSVMKEHSYSHYIFFGSMEPLKRAVFWGACHHEKLDGSGYPWGLKGHQIPLAGKILAVADVASALLEERPYKEPLSFGEALKVLESEVRRGLLDGNCFGLLREAATELGIDERMTFKEVSALWAEEEKAA